MCCWYVSLSFILFLQVFLVHWNGIRKRHVINWFIGFQTLVNLSFFLYSKIDSNLPLYPGDGGNDVSMIQAADAGIGIVGKVTFFCFCFS